MDISDDGFLSLMDDTGNTRDDLKLPDGDLGAEIKSAVSDGRDILVRIFANCQPVMVIIKALELVLLRFYSVSFMLHNF